MAALKELPWHLVDLWWRLPEDLHFESWSMTVAVHSPIPDDVKRKVRHWEFVTLGGSKHQYMAAFRLKATAFDITSGGESFSLVGIPEVPSGRAEGLSLGSAPA